MDRLNYDGDMLRGRSGLVRGYLPMKARTFRRRALAALVAASTALPMAAFAGEIADKAAEAESLLSGGKPQEALAAFDQASEDFWNAAPLRTWFSASTADRPLSTDMVPAASDQRPWLCARTAA